MIVAFEKSAIVYRTFANKQREAVRLDQVSLRIMKEEEEEVEVFYRYISSIE